MDVYTKLTSTINNIFATQLAGSISWQVVPGELVRVSSSPAGYTWGLNATNNVYVCKEPCTGSWTNTNPPSGKILDITTDQTKVYALVDGTERVVYSKSIDGSGSWSSPISAPADSKTVVATSKDIFMDTDRGVFKCGSPCSLPSWTPTVIESAKLTGNLGTFQMNGDIAGNLQGNPNKPILSTLFVPGATSVKPTSASARFAYGVDTDNVGKVYRNGVWHTIPGLAEYSLSAVSGEIDDTAIYATTTDGVVLRCSAPCLAPENVFKVSTPGLAPDPERIKQVSVNPQSKQVWLLSSALHAGSGGYGIYNHKDDAPMDINSAVIPLDQNRSNVLLDIDSQYKRAEASTTIGAALEKTQRMVHDSRPRMSPEEDPRILRRKIDFMDAKKSVFLLQIACATVLVILVLLILLPHPFSTMLSFIAGCFGAMVVVSFSTS